ncbi:MAG: hypothetical protein RIC15_04275 [Vicingaceae bacterium]
MKSILFILFAIFTILILSCSKEEEKVSASFTLSGRLFANCDSVPLANKEILLRTRQVNFASITLAESVTDSKGNFVFTYHFISDTDSPFYDEGLHITDVNWQGLTNVPINNSLSDIHAVLNRKQVFDVFLKVVNPYNNKHQIHSSDPYVPVKRIIDGPFIDLFLYQTERTLTGNYPIQRQGSVVDYASFSYEILGPSIITDSNRKIIWTGVTYVPCGEKVSVEMLVE